MTYTMAERGPDLTTGVTNLLAGCAGVRPGARLLIVREDPAEPHYCPGLPDAVSAAARNAGYRVHVTQVDFDPDAQALPDTLAERMAEVDVTLFLARLGDQLRFQHFPDGCSTVISYALDGEAFSAPFGGVAHDAMLAVKAAVEKALFAAAEITVTCAAGTDFTGAAPSGAAEEVGIRRFPMLVPRPMPASGFSGLVSVGPFLTGTGSRYYDPFTVELDGPLLAEIDAGRLVRFHGAAADVARADEHYDRVAARFGIERNFVHSWHAGIHPGCRFPGRASDNYERWSGSAFGNPRLLHFHTCGAYAPGEICWNVIDPTVTVDGTAVWENGRLMLERVTGGPQILAAHPDLAALISDPVREIGL